jgi:2-amino-4-hydroxy-6-hydroxymethyldihydropteridine diphosphokinase
MAELLAIEADMGRIRGERWGSRIIDLDMLLAQDGDGASVVLRTDILTLPHPLMLERDFVLIPSAAIAGDWMHPISGVSLSRALTDLKQKSLPTALRIFPSPATSPYHSTNSCATPMVN